MDSDISIIPFCSTFISIHTQYTVCIMGWRCWGYHPCVRSSHYIDVIMAKMSSHQITSLTVVYSIVYSGADQRKHQSSASLAFVRGIHRDRWIPRTNGHQRGKCFHLMTSSWFVDINLRVTDWLRWPVLEEGHLGVGYNSGRLIITLHGLRIFYLCHVGCLFCYILFYLYLLYRCNLDFIPVGFAFIVFLWFDFLSCTCQQMTK